MKKQYIECMCHSFEHTIRMQYFLDEPVLYVETFLYVDKNIFRRIWKAIKYAVGVVSPLKSDVAQTSESLLDVRTATEMRNFINDFLISTERNKKIAKSAKVVQ